MTVVDIVHISDAQLMCVSTRYEAICRRLSVIFYIFASIQVIFSTLSVIMHAYEDTGILGGRETTRLEGIIYAIISEVSAGILLIIPVHTTLEKCRLSYSLAKEYQLSKEPMPRKMLKHITSTHTLCFKHPLAYPDCQFLIIDPPPRPTARDIESVEMAPEIPVRRNVQELAKRPGAKL